jgi:hypothetical protein
LDIDIVKGRYKATRIRKVNSDSDTVFCVAGDGSVYEVEKIGLFHRFKKIVEPVDEPEYETCNECVKVHNEIANRTCDDYFTPVTPSLASAETNDKE